MPAELLHTSTGAFEVATKKTKNRGGMLWSDEIPLFC
jgi:hypothetical protein